MIESSGPVPKAQSANNVYGGSDSPVCNGTLSPNLASYPVSPALSPNNSGINGTVKIIFCICHYHTRVVYYMMYQ